MMLVSFGLLTYWSAIPGGDIYSDGTFLLKQTSEASKLYLIHVFQVFFPLIGWLADTWIGRYRAILYGLYIMFVGVILLSIWTLIISYLHPELDILANIFLYASNVVNTLGIATVIATMIPFITDQMIGASSDHISAVIHWYYWSIYTSEIIVYNLFFCRYNSDTLSIVLITISFSGLGVALCSIILGKHWLDKTHKVTNPIKHIVKVLNYARKNKYPENRSALTYWEHDIPSRVDLGKQKYGGPFTEDEVENVKTTLRLIPIIFVMTCVTHVTDTQQQHMIVSINDLACFIRDEECITILIAVISIPVYHLIIRPILHKLHVLNKCSVSLLKLIGCGVILIMAGAIGMTCIEGIGHLQTPNATCMFINNTKSIPISINYYWVTIPLVVKAIGSNILSLFSLQFIIAQSPQEMKGFLIGLFYGLDGIFKLIGINLYRLFLFNRTSGCGFYYYLCHTVILLIILIVYLFLSKNYKLRVRNDPVNVHLIAETHIMAYIEQELDNEEEYRIYTPNENYYSTMNPIYK